MTRVLQMILSGEVQGVGLRAAIMRQAIALGLRGYARNIPNQTVEVVAQGSQQAVEALRTWISVGSHGIRVTDIETRYQERAEEFEGFEIM